MSQAYFTSSKPRAPQTKKSRRPLPELQTVDSDDFECVIEHQTILRMRRKSFQVRRPKVVVAGFDLDGTLVTTRSGYTYASNGTDWKFLQEIEERLAAKFAAYTDEELVFAIFTNQAGSLPDAEAKSFKSTFEKLHGVGKALPRVDFIFASLKINDLSRKAKYRKPGSGMFDRLCEELDADVDLSRSFFVGDAAGRPGDHSADDRGFAENAGLRFYTPEEFYDATFEYLHFQSPGWTPRPPHGRRKAAQGPKIEAGAAAKRNVGQARAAAPAASAVAENEKRQKRNELSSAPEDNTDVATTKL